MLLSFTDFMAFKEMFLEYKSVSTFHGLLINVCSSTNKWQCGIIIKFYLFIYYYLVSFAAIVWTHLVQTMAVKETN